VPHINNITCRSWYVYDPSEKTWKQRQCKDPLTIKCSEDFLSEIGLDNAKLVISTVPEVGANLAIKEQLKSHRSKAVFLATSEYSPNALSLYDQGADYVIMPHHLGGDFVAGLVSRFKLNASEYRAFGKEHQKQLRAGRRKSTYR
jgi:Trk K+ transport system NAD-binding subunit